MASSLNGKGLGWVRDLPDFRDYTPDRAKVDQRLRLRGQQQPVKTRRAKPGAEAALAPSKLPPAMTDACRYDPADDRFQRDCRQCAMAALRTTIAMDTPLFPGSNDRWHPTQYHAETHYDDLPDRKAFGCDWPYAVRRYNGSGVDSYHYQAEVIQRFPEGSPSDSVALRRRVRT